jgi:hypothetical protein
MTKVRYLQCFSGNNGIVNFGDVCEVDDAEAARLVERGGAEFVDGPRHTVAETSVSLPGETPEGPPKETAAADRRGKPKETAAK